MGKWELQKCLQPTTSARAHTSVTVQCGFAALSKPMLAMWLAIGQHTCIVFWCGLVITPHAFSVCAAAFAASAASNSRSLCSRRILFFSLRAFFQSGRQHQYQQQKQMAKIKSIGPPIMRNLIYGSSERLWPEPLFLYIQGTLEPDATVLPGTQVEIWTRS